MEDGRKFKMERRENGVGKYILCSVIDVESKRFCLMVPEGKGIPGRWALFAEKLRELGVATQEEVKEKEASRGESKSEGVLIENKEESCNEKKAMGGKKSYADVTKEPAGKQGDALWLQVGGRVLRNREKGLGRCLVGRWGTGLVGELELQTFKKWGEDVWNSRKGLRMLSMGGPLMMLEFEDEEDTERTLKRGTRRYKDKVLHLERWSVEAGCLKAGSQTKEVWVRVVGLPFYCWSEEILKRIGDCCGGFVEVGGETKNVSQLQWARILVKNRGNFFPGTLHLAADDYCYALQLWWERLPWLSKVVTMKKMKGGEKEKARDDREVGSRAESSSSKGKEMWRVAEEMGPDLVRKAGGEKKLDGDGAAGIAETFSALGKKKGGKGKGVVGLSEGGMRTDQCKSTFVVTQAQMEWALKGRDKLCGS